MSTSWKLQGLAYLIASLALTALMVQSTQYAFAVVFAGMFFIVLAVLVSAL
jgi:hypothetical protein